MPTSASTAVLPRQDIAARITEMPMMFTPIGTQIYVPRRVPSRRGRYPIMPREAMLEANVPTAARGSGTPVSDWESEDAAYACATRKKATPVLDDDRDFYPSEDNLELVAANRSRESVLRTIEKAIQTSVHDASAYTGATNTLAITNEWDDATNATPQADIVFGMNAIRGKTGLTANVLQLSWRAIRDLSLCNTVRESVKYTARADGIVPLTALADILGVEKIVTPGDGNGYNSAKEGATPVFAEIWNPEYAFLCYVPRTADPMEPGVGFTFYHDRGSSGGMGYVDSWRDDDREATFYRFKTCTQEHRFSTDYGFLFSNCVT